MSGRLKDLSALAVFLAAAALGPVPSHGNSDVYAALPADASVVSYATGDLNGDGVEELALLYASGGRSRLAAFTPRQGRWKPWWEAEAPSGARRMILRDATGDGRPEMAVEALAPGGSALITRLLTYGWPTPDGPRFVTILEDATSPPGYALFGKEGGRPAVTFLSLGKRNPDGTPGDGYRRVHCWDGQAFAVCKEVAWKAP